MFLCDNILYYLGLQVIPTVVNLKMFTSDSHMTKLENMQESVNILCEVRVQLYCD